MSAAPSHPLLPSTSDPLAASLHALRPSTSFYSHTSATAPWGLLMPPLPGVLMVHIVTSGRCWLDVDGAEPQLLTPGVLALVPHGEGHRLVSTPGEPTVDLFALPHDAISARYERLRIEGGEPDGEATSMLCGVIEVEHPAGRHMLAMLPRVIHVDAVTDAERAWLRGTIRLIAEEAAALRPGGEAIVTRLADILVIQAIRAWVAAAPEGAGWLGALGDDRIGPAIARIHADPAGPWSVARLAHDAAMSRSAFAERFATLVGESPMAYVTRWRMVTATDALREERSTVQEVALRAGYRSEAAFSRAYRRVTGISPGAARYPTPSLLATIAVGSRAR